MAGSDQNDAGDFVALALLMVRFPYEDIPGVAINAKVATESCEQCRQKLVSRLSVTATGRDAAQACASESVHGQGGSSREERVVGRATVWYVGDWSSSVVMVVMIPASRAQTETILLEFNNFLKSQMKKKCKRVQCASCHHTVV